MTAIAPTVPNNQNDPGSLNPPDSINTVIATNLSLTSVVGITCSLSAIAFIYLSIIEVNWQLAVVAAFFFITGFLGIKGIFESVKSTYQARDLIVLTSVFGLTCIVMSALIQNTALPLGIIFIVYTLIASAVVISTGGSTRSIGYGLMISAATVLMGTFPPFPQTTLLAVNIWVISALSITLIFFVAFLAIEIETSTLQIRLTTAFIAIAIIPISISSIILTQTSIASIQTQIIQNVFLTSDQVATTLDSFIDNNLRVVQQEAATEAFSKYLDKPGSMFADEALLQEIQMAYRVLQLRETSERTYLSSYGLLNLSGLDVYDTDDNSVRKNEGDQEYFKTPIKTGKAYVSPVIFSADGKSFIYFSAPVKSLKNNTILGVLRIRYSALVFQRMMENYKGLLGTNSYAILFDENLFRLADSYTPDLAFTAVKAYSDAERISLIKANRLPNLPSVALSVINVKMAEALNTSDKYPTGQEQLDLDKSSGSNLSELYGITQMKNKPWKVMYLQANFDDVKLRNDQTRLTTLIATLISLLVGFGGILTSTALGAPIKGLIDVAQKITQGDLTARSTSVGTNEFGTLGKAFNQMTDQLRNFINELEQRVLQRTEEIARRNEALTFRTRQLQTVAEVARGIVTVQELTELLSSVTHLISERFDFYHVGIFLLDENKEYAVLRAANSEGGQRMLAREHRLRIGRVGIVGNVCESGKPRIATDVGADSTFFNNPDLPLTRSEMALPLKFGGQTIGALDVQSMDANAFSEDDIELFGTLTDQIAVAIYNNQLYAETLRALAESQTLHRQYLRQEWGSDVSVKKNRAYRYSSKGTSPSEVNLNEIGDVYTTGKPYTISETLPDNTIQTVMAVPIMLRDETIGIIRLQDQGEERIWSEDEISSVQEVAQQIGTALETARLFQKTISRADRERKVLEITGMIRSTNDPQQMLEIAATELRKALGASRAQIILSQPPDENSNGKPSHQNGGNGHISQKQP
jgi:GAF domain-containing protein/HAMP domain-containing protein